MCHVGNVANWIYLEFVNICSNWLITSWSFGSKLFEKKPHSVIDALNAMQVSLHMQPIVTDFNLYVDSETDYESSLNAIL